MDVKRQACLQIYNKLRHFTEKRNGIAKQLLRQTGSNKTADQWFMKITCREPRKLIYFLQHETPSFYFILTSNADFEQHYIEKLASQCMLRTVVKDEYLLREGEECKHVFL